MRYGGRSNLTLPKTFFGLFLLGSLVSCSGDPNVQYLLGDWVIRDVSGEVMYCLTIDQVRPSSGFSSTVWLRISTLEKACLTPVLMHGAFADGGDLSYSTENSDVDRPGISISWFEPTHDIHLLTGHLMASGEIQGMYDFFEDVLVGPIHGSFVMSKE